MLLMSTSTLALLVRIGVATGAELYGERRADQLESVAEVPLKVALIGGGHPIQRIAVDDDARRIDATLVGIAQLGTDDAGLRRRLLLHGRDHGARQLRRGKPGHGRRMG